MTDLSGRLQIHLHRRPGGLAVTIASSRLVGASRVFIGKSPAETAAMLPSLFSVCATAQAAACVSACEMALGQTPSDTCARARELLVDVETAREHLWRLLLDWPGLLGEEPRGLAMARVMVACSQLRSALAAGGDPLMLGNPCPQPDLKAAAVALAALTDVATEQALGQAPIDWLAATPTTSALQLWALGTDTAAARLLRQVASQGWSTLGLSPVPALPPLSTTELGVRMGGSVADAFIATPLWAGAPAESSPYTRQLGQALVADLTRQQGNGLLTRLTVQLVELATILGGLPARLATLEADGEGPRGQADSGAPKRHLSLAASLPEGVGLAQVQAARGLLVHRVAIQAGRVADYRILAPTEWNFHPQGAAALGLATLPADADDRTLLQIAGLFVTALDPCVAYDVRID